MKKEIKYSRAYLNELSNNFENPCQTLCTQAVCKYLGTANNVKYLQTWNDVVFCVRKRFTVRSRRSVVKDLTINESRQKLANLTFREDLNPEGYIMGVQNHALFLDKLGRTVVDTAAEFNDERKITRCYVVYSKIFVH